MNRVCADINIIMLLLLCFAYYEGAFFMTPGFITLPFPRTKNKRKKLITYHGHDLIKGNTNQNVFISLFTIHYHLSHGKCNNSANFVPSSLVFTSL